MKRIDLTGEKFGMLTAIEDSGSNGYTRLWLCRCECGNETIVPVNNLKKAQSCGCLVSQRNAERNTTHNLSNTKIYKVWCGMKRRCYNKNDSKYPHYGGRGIKICDEWKTDFKKFHNWSTKNGFKEDLTIDRINVNGNYSPDNCRWANYRTQARNRRNTLLVTINGITKTIPEWSELSGIKETTLYSRIMTYGWNQDELLKPTRRKRNENVTKS